MSSTDAPTAATALLQKFDSLTRQVENASSQIKRCKTELESVKEKIQQVQADHDSMEGRIRVVWNESAELSDKIRETLIMLQETEQRLAEANLERDNTQRKLEFAVLFAEENRNEFLEKCQQFRVTCNRLRLSAQDGENMRAFLEIHDIVHETDEAAPIAEEDTTKGRGLIEGSQNTNKSAKQDPDLDREIERAQQCRVSRREAERILNKALAEKKKALDRATERSNRVSMQRSQLERIENDVTGMERELTNLLRETRRAHQMGENFARDATRRKERRSGNQPQSQIANHTSANPPVTPSPYSQSRPSSPPVPSHGTHKAQAEVVNRSKPRNPYAKSSAKGSVPSNPYKRNSAERQPKKRRSDGNGDQGRGRNSVERQHPHREGRIRVDRQFSTALEIISHRVEDSVHDDADDSSASSAPNDTLPISTSLTTLLSDSEDDDEDELLAFEAFSKTKK